MSVTVVEIVSFLQIIIYAFQDPLFLCFTLMLAFTVLFNVKRLLLDGL